MAGVHGTVLLAVSGADEMEDSRSSIRGFFEMGVDFFEDGQPATGRRHISDPMDCLRLKLLDMLGSEGLAL